MKRSAQLPAPYAYRQAPGVPAFDDSRPIFVFDGKCALCSGFVQFILRTDSAGKLRLLAAQTPLGEALFAHFGLQTGGDYETNILLLDGRALAKSDGSIRVFELLGLPWSLAIAVRAAPRWLRDAAYDAVARNRLRWFGARDACYAPNPADAARFVQ